MSQPTLTILDRSFRPLAALLLALACCATRADAQGSAPDHEPDHPQVVSDANGETRPKQQEKEKSDPVRVTSGQVVVRETDLSIEGRGIDIDFARNYRSGATKYLTTLGDRWVHSYDQKVIVLVEPHDGKGEPAYVPGDAVYMNFPEGDGPPEDENEWRGWSPLQAWANGAATWPTDWGTPAEPTGNAPWWYTDKPMRVRAFFHDGTTAIHHFDPSSDGWRPEQGVALRMMSVPLSPPPPMSNGIFVPPTAMKIRDSSGNVKTFALGEAGCGARPWIVYKLSSIADPADNKVYLNYSMQPVAPVCPGVSIAYNFYWRLDRIVDTLRRPLNLTYEFGWLKKVTDWTGREIEYTRDAKNNVIQVREPTTGGLASGAPARPTHKYEYLTGAFPTSNEWHLLKKEHRPNEVAVTGPAYIENFFVGSRVVRQVMGGVNASGVTAGGQTDFFYAYQPATQPINHGWFQELGRTLTIDPNGNVELDIFDTKAFVRLNYKFVGRIQRDQSQPLVLGIGTFVNVDPAAMTGALRTDAPGYVPPLDAQDPPVTCYATRTDYHHTSNTRVREVFAPDSHTLYEYDDSSLDLLQRTNLLRVTRFDSQGGPSKSVVYAYDPLYNKPVAIYGPRGFQPGYSPQTGGPTSPERFLQYTTLDYQEYDATSTIAWQAALWRLDMNQGSMFTKLAGWGVSLPPISDATRSNLGDINGDGMHFAGNVIRSERSAKILRDPFATGVSFDDQPIVTTYRYNAFEQLREREDAEQKSEFYEYHAESMPGGLVATAPLAPFVLDPTPGPDGGGFLWKTISPPAEGVQTERFCDALGRIVLSIDGRGFQTQFAYNELDCITQRTDAQGNHCSKLYDLNGQVVRELVTNATPTFDPAGHPVPPSVSSWIGAQFEYDIAGHLVREERDVAAGVTSVIRYRYDRLGNRVLVLKPEWTSGGGNLVATHFDELNRVWKKHLGGITSGFQSDPAHIDIWTGPVAPSVAVDPAGLSTRTTYRSAEKIVREVDAENHTTTYQHDGLNRVVRVDEPEGRVVHRSWDLDDNPLETWVIGEDGHGTGGAKLLHLRRSYDELGRVFQEEEWLAPIASSQPTTDGPLTPNDGWVTTRFKLDANGFRTVCVDDNAKGRWYEFDGLNRTTRERDALGNEVRYRYDRNHNVIQRELYERSHTGSFETRVTYHFYDSLDRIVATVDPLGQTTRYAYDSRGNLVYTSDANGQVSGTLASLDTHGDHVLLPSLPINADGNTQIFAYDLADRALTVTQHLRTGGVGQGAIASSVVLSTAYDLNGRVTEKRDGKGRATSYQYDAHDREVHIGYADGTDRTILAFDRNDLVLQYSDANGSVVTQQYDDLRRVQSRVISRGAGVEGSTSELYKYDAVGRMTVGQDDDSTVVMYYDTMSRRLLELQNGVPVATSFDGKGNNTRRVYPSGRTIDLLYDEVDRPEALFDNGNALASYEYDGFDRVAQRDLLANSTRWSLQYDLARRPIDSAHSNTATGAKIDERVSTWDRVGNRTTRTRPGFVADAFVYDSLDQLVRVTRTGSGSGSNFHRIDKSGNRVSTTGSWYPGSYSMVGDDADVNQYTTTPIDARSYDANGNLTRRSIPAGPLQQILADASYDYRNQLFEHRSYTGAGHSTFYSYDVIGRRIRKLTKLGATVVSDVKYYYAGDRIVEERNAAGQTLATYVHGYYIDEVLAMRRDVDGNGTPEDYYYHSDEQYNVTALSDSHGVPIERYEYGDYGELLDGATFQPTLASSFGNPYFFTGRELDAESGWYYYRTRYYDPIVGRFLSRDSLGNWADPVARGNGYTYCGNNPWSAVDPYGTDAIDFGKGVLEGMGEEAWSTIKDMASSAWDAICHPIDTIKDIANGLAELGDMLKNGEFGEAFETMFPNLAKLIKKLKEDAKLTDEEWGRLTGKALVEVAPLVCAAGGGIKKALDVCKSAKGLKSALDKAGLGKKAEAALEEARTAKKARAAESAGQKAPNGSSSEANCFTAGTLVLAACGFLPIEEIRLGDRVQTPSEVVEETAIDPSAWREIALTIQQISDSPTRGCEVRLLRPDRWLASLEWNADGLTWIDLPEVGIRGWSRVDSVSACPPIAAGAGRVITGTYASEHTDVVEIRFVGEHEPLRATARHPIYSATRVRWVHAGQLESGEHLQTDTGEVEIASVRPVEGRFRVYNLEVDVEHCFFVGSAAVLAHNACPAKSGTPPPPKPPKISMDDAIAKGVDHVGPGGKMEATGKGTNYQFRSTTTDAEGNKVTKIARFDVNPADSHVAKDGAHLNLETHINGKSVSNVHIDIDPNTVRPGDHPR